MSEWIKAPIESLLESSFAGEWGTEPGKFNNTIVFRGADFNVSGRLSASAGVPRSIPHEKLKKIALRPGDILLEKSGGSPDQPVGRVSYFQATHGTAVSSNFLQTLRPRKDVDAEFLFYLLQYEYRTGRVLPFQQQTTGIINFRLKDYLKEVVNLPPDLREQRRIAEVLSALDEQIEQTAVGIQKYRKILDGLIYDLLMSGPRNAKLGELVDIRPKTKSGAIFGRVPFVPMDAVSEEGRLESWGFRPWEQVSSGFTRFASDDVLVAKITPCFENGKGAHVPAGFEVWAGSTEFHVLRAKEGVHAKWIFWYTRSREFRESGAARMTGSAGQQRVPSGFLAQFPVRKVSLEEQKSATDALDGIDSVIREGNHEVSKLRLQKQGLMHDLLTGATRV